MGGGMKELLIILVIVIIIFGTKKFKNIGSDLGSAIKGFKKSIKDDKINENTDLNQNQSIDNTEKDDI